MIDYGPDTAETRECEHGNIQDCPHCKITTLRAQLAAKDAENAELRGFIWRMWNDDEWPTEEERDAALVRVAIDEARER